VWLYTPTVEAVTKTGINRPIPVKSRLESPQLRKRRFVMIYALPRDFMYRFDLERPILDAFFFTASLGRPSLAEIAAVGLFGKSFVSKARSAFDHTPFLSFSLAFFFAIG